MNPILCPNCGKKIELSKALTLQIEKDIVKREAERHERELEEAKKEALEKAARKIEEQFELKLKQAAEETEEKNEQNKKLIGELTQLTADLRMIKKEKDEVKLEAQKKLLKEEDEIRLSAQKKAEETLRLKMLEKDKQLADVLKANEEMRRKLEQGSQQTQGEAFELDFEEKLKAEFPNDKIKEVGKGMRGGDILQEIWDRNGVKCGLILWELKNTKAWSEQWIEKLKADQRSITADYAVIVSSALPNEVATAKYHKNVWITDRNFVIGLACALRINLIQIAMARRANEGKRDKADLLYSYLSGTEFRLRIEAIIEAFTNMQSEIEKEKRYFANKWARDEKNIRQVVDSTYGMHGDLKGIIGNSLPQIKGLYPDQTALTE